MLAVACDAVAHKSPGSNLRHRSPDPQSKAKALSPKPFQEKKEAKGESLVQAPGILGSLSFYSVVDEFRPLFVHCLQAFWVLTLAFSNILLLEFFGFGLRTSASGSSV